MTDSHFTLGFDWLCENPENGYVVIIEMNPRVSRSSAPASKALRQALRAGFTIEEIFNLTRIDRWFLVLLKESVNFAEELATAKN